MQKLIKTEEFYQTIDLIITPVILVNDESKHQYHNRAFLSQIGYSIETVRDIDSWFEVAYPDTKYRQKVIEDWQKNLIAAREKNDTHVHLIAKIYCADGTFKWFDIHENVIGNNKVVTFLDVNELQETNEELSDVLKQKDTLLSIIAHDVRSPLSNIRQLIDNYKDIDLTEKELGDIFFSVSNQIDYVFDIINSMLVRTSGDRGRFTEKQEPINLTDFFAKYRDYYKERLTRKKIHFVFELSADPVVNYDSYILDIICRNLIDNAIKFTPENGTIYISFKKYADYSELVIRDTGAGMSVQQTDLILNNRTSRRQRNHVSDGFGLGLIMAKEILEKNHGKLSIKVELGKGTSFIITMLSD